MTVTLVPINGGYVRNFKIYGEGGSYDDVQCKFKQGYWSNGKLNSTVSVPTCRVTDYLQSEVNIKSGTYTNDLPNGTISEYTFSKTLWDQFVTFPDAGIDSTKHTRTYVNGVLDSTTSTVTQKIKGQIQYNASNKINGFIFEEVA
jgi:hypothetical protein